MNNAHFFSEATRIAEQGRGLVSPNPLVGAVLVRDGTIIAKDCHRKFGENHAERNLLEKFQEHILPTDVLYVTLEPCCHQGKTPPCTDIILVKAVKKIVVGLQDPNPLVNGKGIEFLQKHGVQVTMMEDRQLQKELFWQNRFFFTWIRKKRPWVTLKIAQTLDGRITPRQGLRTRLTGKESMNHMLATRAEYDVVLVGANTVIVDNPHLTARDSDGKLLPHQPRAVILDAVLSIPTESQVARSGTLLFRSQQSPKQDQLKEKGVTVIQVDAAPDGLLDLRGVLTNLAAQNIASVFVEGGPTVWSSFLREGLADELMIYFAPKVMGNGLSTFNNLGFNASRLKFRELKTIENDILWHGYF